jgi:tRNA(Leu) C34 or U34 (ribose-2'-O)-methylase TrmL
MKTKNNHLYHPTGWQLNPAHLDTAKIQYWSAGVMVTLLDKIEAVELVSTKRAFVISGQAIGAMDELGYSIA